jgi:hypothetical protein
VAKVKTPPPPPPPVKTPPPKAPEPIEVKLHARYPSRVSVDDRDLGTDMQFVVKLVPGAHRVVVRHPCCAELAQELQISANKPVYQLDNGAPRNAEFKVLNAPPGSRLLVDGVVIGPADTPPSLAMTSPVRKAKVTIGDRNLDDVILKAGMINILDYAQGKP